MGTDAFGDFLRKLTEDVGMQQDLQAIGEGSEDVSPQDVVNFAAARGYQFTVEDISGELSDEALDAVAGGLAILKKLW